MKYTTTSTSDIYLYSLLLLRLCQPIPEQSVVIVKRCRLFLYIYIYLNCFTFSLNSHDNFMNVFTILLSLQHLCADDHFSSVTNLLLALAPAKLKLGGKISTTITTNLFKPRFATFYKQLMKVTPRSGLKFKMLSQHCHRLKIIWRVPRHE